MARKSGMLPKEVFLSHSNENRPFAVKLANTIRRHGIPGWYSDTNIVPLLYRKCDPSALSWTIQAFQTIDFTHKHADGRRDLLRVCGVGYQGGP